jgi:hypothetical protein
MKPLILSVLLLITLPAKPPVFDGGQPLFGGEGALINGCHTQAKSP